MSKKNDDLLSIMGIGSFGAGKKVKKSEPAKSTTTNEKKNNGMNMFLQQSVAKEVPKPTKLTPSKPETPQIKGRFDIAKPIAQHDEEDVIKITPTTSVKKEELQKIATEEVYDKVRHFEDVEADEDSDTDVLIKDDSVEKMIPVTKFANLIGHTGAVSALTVDPSGTRAISGSHDYSIRFWDFAGMNKNLKSFRDIEEASGGNYPINHLAFSISGDSFLMAPDNVQCSLFDRDGFFLATFKKGDPYILDMKKTKGHIAAVTGVAWHPQHKELCLTSSVDGTCRIWDIQRCEETQRTVFKTRNNRGTKTPVTCCAFDVDRIFAGCKDGSIQVWDTQISSQRPTISIKDAHKVDTNITCVRLSRDGRYLVSRGLDETLKLWDLRKSETPLFAKDDLPNMYDTTDCIFSPIGDERYIVTATTAVQLDRGNIIRKGQLLFLDRADNFAVAKTLEFDYSVIRIVWHPVLNQLLLGCSDGVVRVAYDEEHSRRGVLTCLTKAPKKRNIDEISTAEPVIYTPFALPMFKKEPTKKKLEEKARSDPIKSRKPSEIPQPGPGQGGKVNDNMTHMLMKEMGVVKKATEWQEDPREAILRYAKIAEENPSIVAPAYAKTQPKPVFDYAALEREFKDQLEREQLDEEKSARNRFSQITDDTKNKRQKLE